MHTMLLLAHTGQGLLMLILMFHNAFAGAPGIKIHTYPTHPTLTHSMLCTMCCVVRFSRPHLHTVSHTVVHLLMWPTHGMLYAACYVLRT